MRSLSINRPDDWHVHFRDGETLFDTVPASARHFGRALVMPNLKPALTSLESLFSYRQRILKALDKKALFTPFFSLYLNESLSLDELAQSKKSPFILGAKLYPAGVTTHSEQGVQSIKALYPHLALMQEQNLVLQIHGEVLEGDVFAREEQFLQRHLKPIIQNFPRLRIVLEHISTAAAVEFVLGAAKTVAATITPHHLLYNRNHLLANGVKPHLYCLPILKKEADQKAIQNAATSGNAKFFAGTDSAPHAIANKENSCGCAGIYSSPYAVALYAQLFAHCKKLPMLNAFMGHFGAHFYEQPINEKRIELREIPQVVAQSHPLGKTSVIPIAAGETLSWSVHEFD